MNLTHKHVQTGSVYGLPSRDTMPQMSEAQAFQFGYRHAYRDTVAIYMGPHTEAFKAGCQHGQEARSLRLELANAQLKVEDLTVQRDGLINAIKALRVELEAARAPLQGVSVHWVPTVPIPSYGAHMTLAEFKNAVASGLFTDYDGTGYYATGKGMTSQRADLSNIVDTFSHVVWFNR